jgi:GNAT superfamily N-acetyltransferase/uncharacterized glyoxalase superfamily protein PhnB
MTGFGQHGVISVDLISLNQVLMEEGLPPILSHAEPVLAVQDITETVRYWHEVLGFPGKWTWGDPPNHGGVNWQKVFIQFTLNPTQAAASKGNSVWIRVQKLEALYDFHQKRNANIVAPLENQPWGMAQYTIRELNGYYVHFAGPIAERQKNTAVLPSTVRIIARPPTIKESRVLSTSIGGTPSTDDAVIEKVLGAAIFAVIAEDAASGEVIGSALLLGDDASFYYVKDVMVHPDWQGRRVGTALMQELNRWLDSNGANNALVALIARETLEPFYQQFGFAQAFSMIRYVQREQD